MEHVTTIRKHMQRMHEVARGHLHAAVQWQKQCYDAKCFHKYQPSYLVWYATARGQHHVTPKLGRVYEGPLIVTKKINDLLYQVQLDSKGGTKLIHHDKLKPYLGTAAPLVRANSCQALPIMILIQTPTIPRHDIAETE